MVKKAIAVVALLAAVAVVGIIPIAQSQGDNTETITVRSIDAKDRTIPVDTNDNGEEDAGDLDIGTGPLFDGEKRVGAVRHLCALLPSSQKVFRLQCDGTFTLRGRGSILASGVLAFTRRESKSTFSIAGGTGEFRNSAGSVVLTGTRKGLRFEFRVVKN